MCILLRSNIWHVRGGERDLLVDAGCGVASLRDAAPDLFAREPVVVFTHSHYDHVGGAHEFAERWIHEAEALSLVEPEFGTLIGSDLPAEFHALLDEIGVPMPEALVDALPYGGYDIATYDAVPAPATRLLREGDPVDLGDRAFTVLHLPGHTPGGIALWDEDGGVLFSGDVIYDAPLLDSLPGSDPAAYRATMRRLRDLPVRVVHPGHEPSFGRDRMIEVIDAYLSSRGE
ncbi:MBL fold metallo-hydrolase [Spongiactinospora gelatinilytica]|uniref:MBL fold metallo-hydrolase n=1 Tax=Spongiactinospora gelatinilytica TaxID=2666298 RepID=UPI0018F35298|nr:MBL fold metallo-hydrolase [Spongiactinospora gelatinilytica]